MPRLSRWFVKTSFLYLVATFVVGLLVATSFVWSLPAPFAHLNPVYLQLFSLGWVTQLIFGVANWLFPIYTRENPRRNTVLGWSAYTFLNAGLLLRVFVETGAALQGLLVFSAVIQGLGGLAFVVNIWARVKRR
jgi:hypothetical protein